MNNTYMCRYNCTICVGYLCALQVQLATKWVAMPHLISFTLMYVQKYTEYNKLQIGNIHT